MIIANTIKSYRDLTCTASLAVGQNFRLLFIVTSSNLKRLINHLQLRKILKYNSQNDLSADHN